MSAKQRKQTNPEDDYANVESPIQASPCTLVQDAIPDRAAQGIKNVVIFGECGVGKSSLINLIAGRKVTETSSGALGCTLQYQRHLLDISGQTCAIWDTAGLDEGTHGSVPSERAEAYLKQLLHELAKHEGVDLLVYCVRGTRVRAALLTNYHIFYSAICRKKVPIAIAITGLENQEGSMETWWCNNEPQFASLKMFFDTHACVTTLEHSVDNVVVNERREISKAAAIKMIISTCRTQKWKPPERSWIESAFSDIRGMLSSTASHNARLSTIIMCEAYRNGDERRLTRKRSISFQSPITVSLSFNPLSFRSPIAVSNDVSRNKLPFERGIKSMPQGLYLVYQVSPGSTEEEIEKGTTVKRGADLLIFCVKMEGSESKTIKAQWEYFNLTYGGDLSPRIVVVIGAFDQSSAEKWWTDAVGEPLMKNNVDVAYWPESITEVKPEAMQQQLQLLIADRCLDCSKVTFRRRNEELLSRLLRLDISLTSLRANVCKEDRPPTPSEQDVLTRLGVWDDAQERSPRTTVISPLKEHQYFEF